MHRAVSQLEEEAGERLFERTPQGLVPSRTCSALVPRARLALSELDQADMDLGEIDGRETGRIAIGTLPLSRSVLLPRALAAFRQARPNMRVSVIDGTYEMLLAALRRGDVDLMLGALRSTQPAPDVVQEPLFHDRFAIVARPGHPLAGRGPLHPSELARFPWVGPGTQLRHQFEAIFAAHDLPLPASLIEAGFILLIREYLDLSDALAFTSGRQAAPELSRRNLVQLRVTENLPLRQIGLTMRGLAGVASAAADARLPAGRSEGPSRPIARNYAKMHRMYWCPGKMPAQPVPHTACHAGRRDLGRITMRSVILAAALGLASTTAAFAEDFKFASFFAPTHPYVEGAFEPFAKAVEEKSGGDLSVTIYNGGELGPGPAEQYSRVLDGVAELAVSLPGYTASTFPLTLTAELPGVLDTETGTPTSGTTSSCSSPSTAAPFWSACGPRRRTSFTPATKPCAARPTSRA
ncbi:LysR substrate-binding domain-containing protein [Salipiger sp. CCB-MM3]|uniref:LysR substrate-binding domain-containing protein n=1 Tax=Salipiger sp. CCB-MM3 TaxID=1792508 RepID=UPI00202A05B1|nr:LysR substrate-binding domain-containing protein [Salipiger sp. CCB-MM3]